jgi:hypothetical protein
LEDALKANDEDFHSKLRMLLNKPGDNEPSILVSISTTFESEPNLFHIREWRNFDLIKGKPESHDQLLRSEVV